MPGYGINHSFNTGPWHFCSRCGTKTKLNSELQWQFSKLLCNDCYDRYPILVGAIEIERARALSDLIGHPDLMPSEKITNPEIQNGDNDEIFI